MSMYQKLAGSLAGLRGGCVLQLSYLYFVCLMNRLQLQLCLTKSRLKQTPAPALHILTFFATLHAPQSMMCDTRGGAILYPPLSMA
jgi:hypothetical protein